MPGMLASDPEAVKKPGAVSALMSRPQIARRKAWRYKPETGLGTQPHIGPYAEDFQAAFGVGDGVTINPIDAIGVCLAAIKALSKRVEELEAQLMAKGHGEAA